MDLPVRQLPSSNQRLFRVNVKEERVFQKYDKQSCHRMENISQLQTSFFFVFNTQNLCFQIIKEKKDEKFMTHNILTEAFQIIFYVHFPLLQSLL